MGRFDRELPATVRPRPASELIAGGLTWHVLNGPRWRRTSRGWYVPARSVPSTPTQRIVEAAALLPGAAAIGGWAAAYASGADLLDGVDDLSMQPLPVTMCLPPGLHRPVAPGRRYLQRRLAGGEITEQAGIPVTTPLRTALDLVMDAPDLTEAVVALDAMLATGLMDLRELSSSRARGGGIVRAAVELACSGVRSTWETRLRMLYTSGLGFPCPLVNRTVTDLDGRFLGAPTCWTSRPGWCWSTTAPAGPGRPSRPAIATAISTGPTTCARSSSNAQV